LKSILALGIFCLISTSVFSQASTASPTASAFPKAMATVLHDYTANFTGISGDLISNDVESESYTSTILLPGAKDCRITRYHSKEDITASWQAKMLRTEDFEVAAKQYKELYKHLKACYIKLNDGSSIFLKASLEAPSEEKKFTVTSFKLATTDLRYRELKVELELLYRIGEWEININVVNKKKDSLEPEE
jgi:hypothetical protein